MPSNWKRFWPRTREPPRSLVEGPRRIGILFLGSLLLGLASACAPPAATDPDRVVIGLLVDNDRPIHQPVLNAARLAIEEVEHAGGLEVNGRRIPVELAVEDDISSPEQASSAAFRLINQQRVSVLVGCNLSRNAIPVGEVAERAHVPMISPASTHQLTTENRPFVFRVAFTDAFQGKTMARYAYRDLGFRRIALFYNATELYSLAVQQAFRDELAALGGEVVAVQTFTRREDDLRPALRQLMELNPQALFLPNYTRDIVVIGQHIEALDLRVPLLGSEGWTTEILAGEPGLDGAHVLQHWHVEALDDNVHGQRFVERYQQNHGTAPYGMSALTFDAFGLLFQAIERAGSIEPDAIRGQLAATENFAGTTGTLTYRNLTGDPRKSAVIVRLEGDQVVFEQRIEP